MCSCLQERQLKGLPAQETKEQDPRQSLAAANTADALVRSSRHRLTCVVAGNILLKWSAVGERISVEV